MIVLSIGTTPSVERRRHRPRSRRRPASAASRVFTAVAAVSAQDARGVRALHPVPAEILRAQLATLPWDAAGAVRVGALATIAECSRGRRAIVRARPTLPAVVDPVFAASRGGDLARRGRTSRAARRAGHAAQRDSHAESRRSGRAARRRIRSRATQSATPPSALQRAGRACRARSKADISTAIRPTRSRPPTGVELFTEPRIRGDDARNGLHARHGARLRTGRRYAAADRRGSCRPRVRSRANRQALAKKTRPMP